MHNIIKQDYQLKGDGKIAHLVGVNDDDQINTRFHLKHKFTISGKTFNKAKVCIDYFWDVVGEHKAFINNCDDKISPMETNKILERANDSVGRVGYNVIYSNCEHFATWCRYDVCESSQVNRFVPVAICVAGVSVFIGIIFDITSKRDNLKRLISWIYENSNFFAAFSLIIIYLILGYLIYISWRIDQPSIKEENQIETCSPVMQVECVKEEAIEEERNFDIDMSQSIILKEQNTSIELTSKESTSTGDHETQVSEGGEADLHKYLICCKKNPGHTQFIPVDSFTLNHLSEGHRDNDLCGSGWVSDSVEKFTDGVRQYGGKHKKDYTTCWCKQCQHPNRASHVWWEFDVYTATHVVFDDIEARHTSFRLFYDREDSPVISVDQVSVDQVSVVDVNIERDTRVLNCVTCDKNLADKLNVLWRHYEVVSRRVFDKYLKTRDVDKLCFVVSHPHGRSKQVSIGHWVDRYKLGNDLYKFTYTTSTCPGSGGAAVYCVGYSIPLVHSETLNSKVNCSGAGICF
ncbi:hypothetical protein Btru_031143 [Bulinus truncatus]|nr:hypothetical protein Btru_031143 [Bulinus truncatus]